MDFAPPIFVGLLKSLCDRSCVAQLSAVAGELQQYEAGAPGTIWSILRALNAADDGRYRLMLCEALIGQGCADFNVYNEKLVALEQQLAGAMPVQDRVAAERELICILQQVIRNLDGAIVAERQLTYRLARALYEMGRDDELERFGRGLCDQISDQRHWPAIAKTISLMQYSGLANGLLNVTEQLSEAAPDDPELALLHAKQLVRCAAPRERQVTALQRLLVALPDHRTALHLLARLAIREDRFEEAAEYLETLVRLAPTSDLHSEFGEVLLRLGRQERALAEFAAVGPRLSARDLGVLADVLEDLRELSNRNYYHSENLNHTELRERLEDSRRRLDNFLSAHGTITIRDLDIAAHVLMRVEGTFRTLKHPWIEVHRARRDHCPPRREAAR